VAVSLGLLAKRPAALNAPFLFAREQAERPFVALKLATSIDGRIADAAGSSHGFRGKRRASTCTGCAPDSTRSRSRTTALHDDHSSRCAWCGHPRRPPVRVVFDRRAMLNLGVQLVSHRARGTDVGHVVARTAVVERRQLENSGRAGVPPHHVADGLRMLRDAGDPVALVRRAEERWAPTPRRRSGDGCMGAGAGLLGEGAVSGLSRSSPQPLAEAPAGTPVERRALALIH